MEMYNPPRDRFWLLDWLGILSVGKMRGDKMKATSERARWRFVQGVYDKVRQARLVLSEIRAWQQNSSRQAELRTRSSGLDTQHSTRKALAITAPTGLYCLSVSLRDAVGSDRRWQGGAADEILPTPPSVPPAPSVLALACYSVAHLLALARTASAPYCVRIGRKVSEPSFC